MADMLDSKPQVTLRDTQGSRVPFGSMATPTRKTLLEPGHEAEWAEINREEDEYRRRTTRALTMAERIEQGQKLSQQAVSLLAASITGGHVPRRAFWS
jgi:mannose/cellobiose epimerase-like protein (N-acyl-D-glucosamine 2-epimerase family)